MLFDAVSKGATKDGVIALEDCETPEDLAYTNPKVRCRALRNSARTFPDARSIIAAGTRC